MTQRIHLTAIAAGIVVGLAAAPAFAQSGEAAQVIFTNDKLTVIDARGVERVVRQGDFIQPGERLITPPGVIGQIKLPDGTLLGARPGTDLKLDSIVKSLGKNIVTLNEGNLRVVNVEPPKGPKPMPVDVVSPISTLQITTGDGEAIHVKPGSKQNVEPGTYNRLQQGNAVVRNDRGELPLPPMQPVFAPRLGVPLTPIAFLPISLIRIDPIRVAATGSTLLVSPTLSASLIGDLTKLPTGTPLALSDPNLKSNSLLPGNTLISANIGTATPTGTTGSGAFSPALTPQYIQVDTRTLQTARILPTTIVQQPKIANCKLVKGIKVCT